MIKAGMVGAVLGVTGEVEGVPVPIGVASVLGLVATVEGLTRPVGVGIDAAVDTQEVATRSVARMSAGRLGRDRNLRLMVQASAVVLAGRQ